MDNLEQYKDSGILELYVYGLLSEQESIEVSSLIQKHPELKSEVEQIEKALIRLSADYYPKSTHHLKPKLGSGRKHGHFSPILTWTAAAAAIVLMVISGILYFQNHDLQSEISELNKENRYLENQIIQARGNLAKTNELLQDLRARDIIRVPLKAQEVAPDAFALAYLSSDSRQLILDVKDLPDPPDGMVYQVWALEFDPLTPSSMGVLDEFETNEEKLFYLTATSNVQGFGITLEPAGGSPTPNLDQLYVLGVIES